MTPLSLPCPYPFSLSIQQEDSLLQKDWECTSYLFPRTRDLKHLQLCPRPVPLALPPHHHRLSTLTPSSPHH
ncbi:hypothetical protein MJG53_013609 [Ovis ammon polii x Ovis aries]|uniref:Uncharacterized protein n=1 Tax=Ovis ammon polii x Ovis aries TaxID=2918886 RepID=A0ACB9UJ09_9CETA|nr:hypothetical protein MJG53_013609 [Ovis ammon polii x Ovis aries]